MKTSAATSPDSPSRLIDGRIAELGDCRGERLAQLRALIKEVDPNVVEEWKWRGVPTWYHDGMVCTGETYKSVVKVTFAKAPSLRTPRACSTPASREISGGRSISTRATRSMRPPSRRWSATPWP